jgi:protein-tyrosine phosphatase
MMVDIHTHVLPGIDDGPGSLEDAAEMVLMAARDGTDTIVATPHRFDSVHPMPGVAELRESLARLQAAVGETVRLVLGSEVRFTHQIVEHICVTREAPTINGGSYALVEMPPFDLPAGCEGPIYELSSAGIRVVIAHPERNRAVQERPDRFYNFMELGIYGQVDSASLLGRFGKASEATARVLLECNMAHAIASDGHSPRRRKPVMSAAVEVASNLIGGEAARALVDANPRAMVEDRPLPHTPESVPPSSRRRRWFLFKGR